MLLPLFECYGEDMASKLDGDFSFALYDTASETYYIARDPLGVTSLYHGWTAEGAHMVASELKALTQHCESIEVFPPGHYFSSKTGKLVRYYNPVWRDSSFLPSTAADLAQIRAGLETAVRKRLMADVPYGVLLSGGLDSSLVAAIANRFHLQSEAGKAGQKLKSFAIGLYGAPDLVAAQKVGA